jgi:sialic acid synthase SpsE
MGQVVKAVEILGEKDLIILHCISTYPAEHKNINLKGIHTLEEKFPNVVIGYSGHERGVQISVAAAVMGAKVIERHITLDRAMWGSDQAASLEPKGMDLVVRDIRTFEDAHGDGVKSVLPEEESIIAKLRRKTDF